MVDFLHFFGIKDKENRFLMKLTNPYGFDILSAQIALSGLFSTHGACPAANDVTWTPWKSGKSMYQWWAVTPNKLGIIKSATPTLTLDGVPYLGLPIYLLSLNDYIKIYANSPNLAGGLFKYWFDLAEEYVSFTLSDFVPASIGELDVANMAGIFYNLNATAYNWNTIKPWIEAGNIFIDINPKNLANNPFTITGIDPSIGDYVEVKVNEPELFPIQLKKGSISALAGQPGGARYTGISPPGGWTSRTLVELNIAGTPHAHIIELTHTASGGKYIPISSEAQVAPIRATILPEWWYPILVLQYPMMKLAAVANSYSE